MQESRRSFFSKMSLMGFAGLTFPAILSARNTLKKVNEKGLTILFQGDSITDGARTRNKDWNHIMGHGYAYLISSRLWFDYPKEDLMFYNRGISGNKVKDLLDRWQKDTIDLKPDVLSILIGVNDVSRIIANEYTLEEWQEKYKKLLHKTKAELPNTSIYLCEPFLLIDDWPKEKKQQWEEVMKVMQKMVRQLAEDYNCVHIALQEHFDTSLQKAPAKYWVWDGVHPMPAGHELIARIWINKASKHLGFLKE
ncbi:SGNH/GDSL hydrolase family protein [Cyclobacterium sp. 1_MG-2023]|uniref:SGNH/GDSL hydrolase family protein n=1 Tax=Cyclobacterium sp. 1_MG-2023 TaxID=3062681 RepID=UPI0026E123BD|nr:SGNH/GDSL hydrolase family protein [Cyclobacterium sp. 1_MG-2023]MDO6438949.1 SGNH/GDSL hydrolase family protein [Cyclobacterium sp. 1_MG-2023]